VLRRQPTTRAVERCELSGRGREPNVPAGGEGRQRLRTEANRSDGGGGGVKRFARG